MTPDEYRENNSYQDVVPMDVKVADVVILALKLVAQFISGLHFLAQAHYNHRVERKAVAMEMQADLEALAR